MDDIVPSCRTHGSDPKVNAMADQQLPTPVEWLDSRLGVLRAGAKKDGSGGLRKVYPEHWSYLLGEVALYSFVILILTGIFLTF